MSEWALTHRFKFVWLGIAAIAPIHAWAESEPTGRAGGWTWPPLVVVLLLLTAALYIAGIAKMYRTRLRPLPDGRLQPIDALVFGALITAGGVVYLTVMVNALSALLTATIVVSYLFAYTPLKQKTSLCSLVGAIPGALPPVIGWAAARATLSIEAWILFTIMFLWQMPHSLAIGWLYRDDYARAGFRLLPVVDPDGKSTGRQIVSNCLALLAVGLIPTLIGFAGLTYFFVALVLGSVFLWYGVSLALSCSQAAARRLLFASLVYLPVLLAVMAFDKVPF